MNAIWDGFGCWHQGQLHLHAGAARGQGGTGGSGGRQGSKRQRAARTRIEAGTGEEAAAGKDHAPDLHGREIYIYRKHMVRNNVKEGIFSWWVAAFLEPHRIQRSRRHCRAAGVGAILHRSPPGTGSSTHEQHAYLAAEVACQVASHKGDGHPCSGAAGAGATE